MKVIDINNISVGKILILMLIIIDSMLRLLYFTGYHLIEYSIEPVIFEWLNNHIPLLIILTLIALFDIVYIYKKLLSFRFHLISWIFLIISGIAEYYIIGGSLCMIVNIPILIGYITISTSIRSLLLVYFIYKLYFVRWIKGKHASIN
jgi:hypothetical protein